MLAHVQCFVFVVLVVGYQCAPDVYRVGVSHGISGQTGFTGGGRAKGSLNGGLADSNASLKLGASGSGEVDGSVFVQTNDKIVEAAGDYHGSAGGWVNPKFSGHAGKNSNGKGALGSNVKWRSNSEHSGAGSGGIYTNEDALTKFNEHHSRTANDILQAMDNDNDY